MFVRLLSFCLHLCAELEMSFPNTIKLLTHPALLAVLILVICQKWEGNLFRGNKTIFSTLQMHSVNLITVWVYRVVSRFWNLFVDESLRAVSRNDTTPADKYRPIFFNHDNCCVYARGSYFDRDGCWRHRSVLGNVGPLHRRRGSCSSHVLKHTQRTHLQSSNILAHAKFLQHSLELQITISY